MKRLVLTVVISLLVVALGLFGAKAFLFPDNGDKLPDQQVMIGHEDGTVEQIDKTNPIKKYSDGVATFEYDGSKLSFYEMPSDDENGYPLTSFQPIDSDDPLPRIDIIPLKLDKPFTSDMPQSDWENFAKTLMLAYYNEAERGKVQITTSGTALKFGDGSVKMFTSINTTLDGSATPNMSGSIRMIANDTNAVVTLALVGKGGSVSPEMYDTYMSATLN